LQVSNWIINYISIWNYIFYYKENVKANNVRASAKAAFEQVENNPATTSGELAAAGETVMAELKRADAVQGYNSLFFVKN
jgi:hypothetical protein